MVRLSGVERRYSGFTLGPVDLCVPRGSFFMLMGPTGSGKTLVLETVAGLSRCSRGAVHIGSRNVTTVKPGRRGVGIVYQDSALFPHLTVRENIEYGRGRARGSVPMERIVEMLDLKPLLERMPGKLSGGEKQRTALARVLVTGPEVVLLDEPMSSLDPHFRNRLRGELRLMHQSTGTTFIMATHDFSDALSLGTEGAVIHRGRIEQQGSIHDIFFKPATPFMAEFVGMRNVFDADFTEPGTCCVKGLCLRVPESSPGSGAIAVSPDSVHVSVQRPVDHSNAMKARVEGITRDGYGFLAELETEGITFYATLAPAALDSLELHAGGSVWLGIHPGDIHVFQ